MNKYIPWRSFKAGTLCLTKEHKKLNGRGHLLYLTFTGGQISVFAKKKQKNNTYVNNFIF